MDPIVFVQNQFVPESQAVIPANDLGILRGYGVFEYLRTYQGVPFHLEDHLLRMQRSAEKSGLFLPYSQKEITEIVYSLLRKNAFQEAGIKLVLTAGKSNDGFLPLGTPTFYVLITPFIPFPEQQYSEGITLQSATIHRPLPEIKTLFYFEGIQAKQKAQKEGYEDAVLLDDHSRILELSTANIFAFIHNRLITPDHNILKGITRKIVLQLASKEFVIEIRDLFYEELLNIDEMFLTSSNREVMPIIQIDHHQFNQGKVGKKTQHLMQQFQAYTHSYPSVSLGV